MIAGRCPGGNGPDQRSSCRRASSWYRLWRSRRGPPPPARRWARAWGRRRCREGWQRRGCSFWIGSSAAHLPPSGPRDRGRHGVSGCREAHGCSPCSAARSRAWNAGAARTARNWTTRRARSSGESGPTRRVVEAGRNFGEGIRAALALGPGLVRIVHVGTPSP